MRSPALIVKTLGIPHVSLGNVVLDIQGKNLAILAYLAVEGETTRERLADLLWSDGSGDAARRNLRVQLHRLRHSGAGEWLIETAGSLALKSGVEVDLAQFRASLAAGDLAGALAYAQGDFLDHLTLTGADAFDEWREATAHAVRDEQWRALDAHAGALSAAGKLDAALSLREQAVRLDPLRERSVRALMEHLLQMRQFDAAHNAYVSLARRLQDELGMTPLPATQALRDRIEVARAESQQTSVATPSAKSFPTPLVGRSAARKELEASRSMLVLGEAGVGKSRLVLETAGRDALILRAAPELSPLPFGALFELLRATPWDDSSTALRERLMPVLAQPESALPLPDRASLLDALASALIGVLGERTLIVEDVHWADASTLECVFLALFRGAKRVWLTARWSELQTRPELLALLSSRNVPRLRLAELSETDVGELIQRMAGQQAPLFSRRLHEATAGHPLFLVETLRGLRESGELTVEGGVWHTPYDTFTVDYAEIPVPPSVTEAIADRLERLGPQTQHLLQAGALWGEQFPAEVLAAVYDLNTGTVLDDLERAETARLVIPDGTNYRFGHELYRRVVAAGISGPRTRFLHSKLARLAPAGTSPVKVAEHYERSGEAALAWPFWRAAAQEAERLFSHEEAIALYDRALHNDPPLLDQFEMYFNRSQLQRHIDDFLGQKESLRHLREVAGRLNDPDLSAKCAMRCAKYATERDHYQEAVQVAQDALRTLGNQISETRRADLLLEAGAALACLGQWAEAQATLRETRQLSWERAPQTLNGALYWLGYCCMETGDYAGAEQVYREALSVLPPNQVSRSRIMDLWKHGMALRLLGRYEEARRDLEQARAEADTLHSTSLQGVLITELGLILAELGDLEGASHLALQAVDVVGDDLEANTGLEKLRARLGIGEIRTAN